VDPYAIATPVEIEAGGEIAWGNARRTLRVQVFGALTALGRDLAGKLLQLGHPPANLALYDREERRLAWRENVFGVQSIGPHLPSGANLPAGDLAFLCTGSALAQELLPILIARGTRIVDLSGAARAHADAALVAPFVNAHQVGPFASLVALPSAPCTLLVPALAALEESVGLAEVGLTLVVPRGDVRGFDVGGSGLIELADELAGDVRLLLRRRELFVDVHPLCGGGEPLVRFACALFLRRPLDPREARATLATHGGVALGEDVDVIGGSAVGDGLSVARIRGGSRGPCSLCFSASGEALRAGGSLAALRVAARL
jgi:aspartate-semialdehyde dehydrogenase